MLAIHQEIQEEVYREIWETFGDSDRDIIQEEMVIKETLRMFPAVPVFQRESAVELQIGKSHILLLFFRSNLFGLSISGNYIIPKNTSIVIFSPAVHRNEIYWPNSHIFDPTRFTPEEIAKRDSSSLPRNCIGKLIVLNSSY